MNILKSVFLAAITGLLTAGAVSAATFSFTGAVTDSNGPAVMASDPDLPPVGTLATVELNIDDSNPADLIFSMGFSVIQAFEAKVTVPGYIAGSMTNNPNPIDFFQITADHLAFGAYGPSSIVDPGSQSFFPNGRHSFRIDFGATAPAVPTTVGDVVAALNAPGASGFFSHELDVQGGGFIFTRVEFPADVSEVPLPASGIMLFMALGGFGWVARKTSKTA